MPKKFLVFFILLLPVLLSGCAKSASNHGGSVSFMVFGDPAELKAYQQLSAAFEAQNPGAKVELIHIPSQTDYRKRLSADFAAGTPADVVLMNYRRYAPFAAKGALEPLEPYLKESKVLAHTDFYEQALDPFTWRGQVMCIPQNLSSLVVYYNKNLFDQAGLSYPANDWSWEDFLRTAQALTLDLDGDGRADQHGLGFEVSLARFAPFIWQHGGEITNSDLNPTALALDWPLSAEAITWVVELQTKYQVTPDLEQEAAEDSESRFLNGRLAMYLNSRRGVPAYREITTFDWDAAPLPRDQHQAGVLHADGYCMAAKAVNKDLVWAFIEFANSPQGQQLIAATGRTVPSLKSVAESAAFLDPGQKPANSRGAFLDPLPYIRALPATPTWIDAEEAADQELIRAFFGQVSVKQAIEAAIRLAGPFLVENE